MTVHTPGLDNASGVSIFARSTDVINDPIWASQFALAHFFGDFRECPFPGDTFPFPFAAFADSLQWIKDSFWIINLIVCCGTFSTVTSAAARVDGVTFKLADFVCIFVHVSEKPAT